MKPLNALFLLGISTATLTLASPAFAASFDCSKGATKVEKAICTDDDQSFTGTPDWHSCGGA